MNLEDLLSPKPQVVEIPDYIKTDPEMVGYPDVEMQDQIYGWALSEVNTNGKTILDVGAGRGDIFRHIDNCKEYIGFEINEILCKAVGGKHDRFTLFNADYLNVELTHSVDIALLIGTLNSINAPDKWNAFNLFFNKMYNECTECCIFILNCKSDDESLNDFPFNELFINVLSNSKIPFNIDYSYFEDIYKLTIFK